MERKNIKKIIFIGCILVSLIVAVGITPIHATESSYPTLKELLDADLINLREISSAEPLSVADEIAAQVTLYSSTDGKSSIPGVNGHSWIVVKNYVKNRTYGTYKAGINHRFTMGTWGNAGYNGIWYNKEKCQ